VSQFWSDLAELIKNQEPYSPIHDIALINCPIPALKRAPETPEQRGVYASHIFDEAVKRVYEMVVLKEWYDAYKVSATPKQVNYQYVLQCEVKLLELFATTPLVINVRGCLYVNS
jgi:hypothetical protein